MCWVVNQVGRPNGAANFGREAPPVDGGAATATAERPSNQSPISVTTDRDVARSERLERPSPVSMSQTDRSELGTVVEAEAAMEIAGDVRIPPPPTIGALLEMRTAGQGTEVEADIPAQHPQSPEFAAQNQAQPFLADEPVSPGDSGEARGALQSSTVYTVRKGDSLYRVCREFYGDKQSEGIKLVLAENPRVATRKDHMLQLGEVLELPPIEGANGMALDMGGMESSVTQTVRVLTNPVDAAIGEEKPQPREVPVPKLTQNTTRKSPAKKSPAKSSPPREERPKVRPSSPKPPPPSTKLAMKTTPSKPRASSATEANRKPIGKATGSKPSGKSSATRKDAAAIAPKSSGEKRPAQPPKKNARRALIQESLEHEPPGLLARNQLALNQWSANLL